MAERQRLKEKKASEKKARRAEINRKISEDKKKAQDKQLGLFDSSS